MVQLRDITRVNATNFVSGMQATYQDDEASTFVPDDFKTWNELEKDGFANVYGFEDN